MNETLTPPAWFRLVAWLALLWNLVGVAMFFVQLLTDPASLPAPQQDFYAATPAWATVAFGVAVFGGTLGCIGLLLRRSWAVLMLTICLLGIVVQISHSLFIGKGLEVFGPIGLLLPLLTFSIGVALVWLSRYAAGRGWYLPA